ncbi:hypothetical protein P4H27_00190 [Paenibacillus taichungensis]|uniref:hypothetical protein n=1 Tax=Paenibacillus taichungensis TaxID=484184 RepID=UPI002DBEA666|nr:hypothetical protein [Paenibacillus taichungensis]MEC0105350.1 hypothetical protein [Paenibacillus taichungensis]MEC0200425.1 hypothetical protein [Paenibacillus taichungensis]
MFKATILLTTDSTAVIKVMDYKPGKVVQKDVTTKKGVVKKDIKIEGTILFIVNMDVSFKRNKYDIQIGGGKVITAKFISNTKKWDKNPGPRQVIFASTTPEL